MPPPTLCLVLLRDLPLFRTVIPSKIFEYMGAGRPILTTVDGESRGIVERAGAGIFSPPEDADALTEAIRGLARDPGRLEALGRSGRAYVERNYFAAGAGGALSRRARRSGAGTRPRRDGSKM